jgi:hypothetical protein
MKIQIRCLTILLSITLAGCGPKWVKLDDTKASAEEIEKAKVACNVDYQLSQIENMKKAIASEQNKVIREAYEANLRRNEGKVYADIGHCMLKQGLKQPYHE